MHISVYIQIIRVTIKTIELQWIVSKPSPEFWRVKGIGKTNVLLERKQENKWNKKRSKDKAP